MQAVKFHINVFNRGFVLMSTFNVTFVKPKWGPSIFKSDFPASQFAGCVCCMRERRLATYIRRHLSFPPLATRCPSGLQSTANTCTPSYGEKHAMALLKLDSRGLRSPHRRGPAGPCSTCPSWCPRLWGCCRCCRWPAACCPRTRPPGTPRTRGPAGT